MDWLQICGVALLVFVAQAWFFAVIKELSRGLDFPRNVEVSIEVIFTTSLVLVPLGVWMIVP